MSNLVPVNDYAVMTMDTTDLREVIDENLGGHNIEANDLDKVTVPAGGSTTWVIPTLDGEIETKTLEGILVYFAYKKAYWAQSFEESGGGTVPDCVSDDCITGQAMTPNGPGGLCEACPFNKFGSDGRKGKACRDMIHLYMLRPDSLLPLIVVVPPTSIKPIRQFMYRLTAARKRYTDIVIGLSLEKTKNDQGITYSVIKPQKIADLTPEQAKQVRAYAEAIRPALQRVRVSDVLTTDNQ